MTDRERADRLLVARGLFESRAKAQAAIAAGLVTANGLPVAKPAEEIPVDAALAATPAFPWVSRGGLKLVAALDRFGFDPKGHACLDVGASTGGFTEVLLARGAARVYAVDVGRDQLHPRLRARPEVAVMEATDIRALAPDACPVAPVLAVVDVSFIPLAQVLPAVTALLARPAALVALIKPQFEAGRAHLKKGIVRDDVVHREVCERVSDLLAKLSWTVVGVIPSPILGGDGNREFLIGATRD